MTTTCGAGLIGTGCDWADALVSWDLTTISWQVHRICSFNIFLQFWEQFRHSCSILWQYHFLVWMMMMIARYWGSWWWCSLWCWWSPWWEMTLMEPWDGCPLIEIALEAVTLVLHACWWLILMMHMMMIAWSWLWSHDAQWQLVPGWALDDVGDEDFSLWCSPWWWWSLFWSNWWLVITMIYNGWW